MQLLANDLDYLAARLHGRRSRLAEADRLDVLCRLRTVPELAHALYPECDLHTATEIQRRLVQDLARELSLLLGHLAGAGERLLAWLSLRFHLENLKVLMRGFVTGTPVAALRDHLIPLPKHPEMGALTTGRAESLIDFVALLPAGPLRKSLARALAIDPTPAHAFFLEAALDHGYFDELLARVQRLSGEDKEGIQALVFQEVDVFHLMVVLRGRFHYGLKEELLPLHVPGTRLSRTRFTTLLGDPDFATAAGRAVGCVLEALPATITPEALEVLAWQRFLHLANRTFRRGHMGLGAVVGYCGIRRVEVANLITLCEGIRIGAAATAIRARLLPQTDREAAYV